MIDETQRYPVAWVRVIGSQRVSAASSYDYFVTDGKGWLFLAWVSFSVSGLSGHLWYTKQEGCSQSSRSI